MIKLKRLSLWCAWMSCAGILLIGSSTAIAVEAVKEIAPGVLFEKNVVVPMRDGSSLIANVYRPKEPGTYPVIMSLSAYSKDLHTKAIHAGAWDKMLDRIPGLLDNSSGLYHGWELLDPDGNEVTFEGASEEAVPITQGRLRVSQRKLVPDKSTPERPYHSHDEAQPLEPGKIYEVQVEIWPTSIVVPRGYTLTLLIEGRDFSRGPGGSGLLTGSGPFLHNDRNDRPIALFGGTNTLHTGGSHESYLLIPVIPRS